MSEPQNLAVLGSTGSIGRSALEVVRHHPERLRVAALAAFGSDTELLACQIEEFRPPLVAVVDEAAGRELVSAASGSEILSGEGALVRVVEDERVERVLAAVVGAAGLPPVYAALAAGKDVALANKESLVVAGSLLERLSRDTGARILPVDSEHVAIHQALRGGRDDEVRRIFLTASGGPFRRRSLASWGEITADEALAHPTWQMGQKITIDSATLMNKGLELIEATHLFSMPEERIEVVIHPQSIVHSMVEFCDGSVLAQLSVNDMALPIQYALAFPDRWSNELPRLEVDVFARLDFEPLDDRRFPSVALARRALEMGDSAPAVFNAANEEAVGAFLAGEIAFPEIVGTVERVLDRHRAVALESLDEALSWDRWGRDTARDLLTG